MSDLSFDAWEHLEMAPRVMSRSSERWLEWGTKTSLPGSRVLDCNGEFVFTGSRVCAATDKGVTGVVVRLIDERSVVVAEPGIDPVAVDPRHLRVTVALP